MSMGFFSRTRRRAGLSAPPVTLPVEPPHSYWSTEDYKKRQYTPMPEMIVAPAVGAKQWGTYWNGRSNGNVVLVPVVENGATVIETVLVLDGVEK